MCFLLSYVLCLIDSQALYTGFIHIGVSEITSEVLSDSENENLINN